MKHRPHNRLQLQNSTEVQSTMYFSEKQGFKNTLDNKSRYFFKKSNKKRSTVFRTIKRQKTFKRLFLKLNKAKKDFKKILNKCIQLLFSPIYPGCVCVTIFISITIFSSKIEARQYRCCLEIFLF